MANHSPPQSPPQPPLAEDFSENMHLAPGYKEFLRGLILRGGALQHVHETAWRRTFPEDPVPVRIPPPAPGPQAPQSSEEADIAGDAPPPLSPADEDRRPSQRRRIQ